MDILNNKLYQNKWEDGMFLKSSNYDNLKKRQGYNRKRPLKNRNLRGNKGNRNYVMIFSLLLTATIVSVGILFPEKLNYISTKLFNVLVDKFSPMYLLLMLGLFVFSLYLAFSKYGDIKLGKENDKPEFSNVVWFSMLFGAGMGIGLVFLEHGSP